MSAQELIILVIVLALCLLGLYSFRYMLKVLRNKIEAFKRGDKCSKRTLRLIDRMQKHGQVKFYILQGVVIWGVYFSIGVTILSFLFDLFFDKGDIDIVDYTWNFLRMLIIFSISGLIYARVAWKAYH